MPNFSKSVQIFFSTFGMELPNDGTNELSKDGFDGIALKVIFKVGQVRLAHFHIFMSDVNTVLKYDISEMVCRPRR